MFTTAYNSRLLKFNPQTLWQNTVEPLSADTPEIRTSMVLRTVCEVPNEIPFTYVYLIHLKADTSLFRIADMWSCPHRYLRWVILRTAHPTHATQNVKWAKSVSRLGSGSVHSMAPSALLQFLACQWVGPGAHNYNRVMQLRNARASSINYNRDPWNVGTSLIRTLAVGPTSVRFRGVPL